MAPPARGTKEYQTYLQKQQIRRARQRLQRKQEKLATQAKPLVRAGVKRAAEKLQEQVSSEVQKKNRYMRKNNELLHTNSQLLATNVALEKNAGSFGQTLHRRAGNEDRREGSGGGGAPHSSSSACSGEVGALVESRDLSRRHWLPEQAEVAWTASPPCAGRLLGWRPVNSRTMSGDEETNKTSWWDIWGG